MRTTLPSQVPLAQPGGQICPAGFCLESNAEIRSERPQAAPRRNVPEENGYSGLSIPIVVDDTRSRETLQMSRCTYFSIRCDTPSAGWEVRLGDRSIPFLMLGLSGVIYRPSPEEELFDDPGKLEFLFKSIEEHPDLYIDISNLWIPTVTFGGGSHKRGMVYRITKKLFDTAYRFTNNEIQTEEYLTMCKEMIGAVRYSPLETGALKKWGEMHIREAKNIYYCLPEKPYRRKE